MNLSTIVKEINVADAPRRRWEDSEIVEGAPATYYIGSDSYGETVSDVLRFKSGARKGQIKEIHIREDAWSGPTVFRPEVDSNGKTHYLLVTGGRKAWYGELVVGFRQDYRDPHF